MHRTLTPNDASRLTYLAGDLLDRTASAHPVLLLCGTLTAISVAIALICLRVPRPLPVLTQVVFVSCLLSLLGSLGYPPLLLLAGFGWLLLVVLLLLDELLLLHNEKRLHELIRHALR